jgi:hypothetical protein
MVQGLLPVCRADQSFGSLSLTEQTVIHQPRNAVVAQTWVMPVDLVKDFFQRVVFV